MQMKEELIENIRFKECYEHEKEINMKSKLGKLKEIKYLLT